MLFINIVSPEFQKEGGIGWGIFVFSTVVPFNAVVGAYFGIAFGLARLALEQAHRKKAGWICSLAASPVVGLYILLYVLTGVPSPTAMHHVSEATEMPSTYAQDVRDGLSLCGPLLVALPFFLWGISSAIFDKTSTGFLIQDDYPPGD